MENRLTIKARGSGRAAVRARTWLALLTVTALAACGGGGPQERFEQYLQRLANTLSVQPQEPATTPLPRPPRPGSLRLDVDGGKVDALDFLALSGCAVQVTIGKRNSSLGRMARDSQRLLLELEYLRLAPDCVSEMRAAGRDALATSLQEAWQLKRAQLPALVFNATLGAEEYRSFWQPTRAPGAYPAVGDSSVTTSLAAVNAMVERWLSGDYSADNLAFELALGDIAGGGGGALLGQLALQHDWLNAADRMLQARAEQGPLCAPSYRHRAADILPGVVRRFFIDGIQPHAAVMENRRYALLPPIAELEQMLGTALPPNYREWQEAREALLELARGAPKSHVSHLQKILAPCDTAPGG